MASTGRKVAIVGSGRIGQQWAALFASGGFTVCLHDVDAGRLTLAVTECRTKLTQLHDEGLAKSPDSVDKIMGRVTTATGLREAVKDAVYVQECVFEDPNLKKDIFLQLDTAVGDDMDVVLASSTSAMQPSEFTQSLTHRSQCLVAHPIMPPVYVPLVELVPAPWTADRTVDLAYDILTAIGQSPIRLRKEMPGFAVGNMQYAIFTRAWQLVCDNVVSVEDVDKVLSEGFGMRYAFFGPIGTMHLNADGIAHHQQLYGPGVRKVCESAGLPVPPMNEPAHVDRIAAEMNELMPLEKLNEWRLYREKCLSGLNKLKRQLENERPK